MNKSRKTNTATYAKHPYIFKAITILIPFLILFAFEGVLRLLNYGDNLDLFVRNETPGYEDYMMVNPEIGKKYFQKVEHTSPPNDIFYAKKQTNTFRIFVMGSSTVYGFPYDHNLMFSRILNKQLADLYPDKRIEVVNTAITAINSFTLLDYVDEIIDYEPDAILFYAGHNEFYGAFGIGSNEAMGRNRNMVQLHISLMKFRMYQLLRNSISSIVGIFASNSEQIHGPLMKRMIGDADIVYNSDEYRVAMKCYRQNMEDILNAFQQKSIPVFLSDLVSNVKGLEPFNSVSSNDSIPLAINVFHNAEKAELEQDFTKACQLYYYAKDLDCIRFRASEEVNSIVDELAKKNGVVKVSMLNLFKENSENNLIGNNLMTEHVHPNIEGIFLMARAYLDKIVEEKIIGEADKTAIRTYEYYKRNWGYTALDSLHAVHRVNILKGFWPFVKANEKEYHYLQFYQPKNKLDSIVVSVLKNPNGMLSEARLDLASSYLKQGKIDLAYKEYEALLRYNPYIAINYRDAANCLIMLGDLPLALKYFKKSLEYEDSFLANYRIGEIYLMKSDFENAIYYLSYSFELAPDERKKNVLGKIYTAYVYSGKMEKAEAVAKELQRVNASSFLEIKPYQYLYNQHVPYQTRDVVLKARELANEQNYQEAIEMLQNSFEIYDSHIAKRILGEIYYEQGNFDKALTYFDKVYKEFKFDSYFLHNLIMVHINVKDKTNAQKYLNELTIVDPNFSGLANLSKLISGL